MRKECRSETAGGGGREGGMEEKQLGLRAAHLHRGHFMQDYHLGKIICQTAVMLWGKQFAFSI